MYFMWIFVFLFLTSTISVLSQSTNHMFVQKQNSGYKNSYHDKTSLIKQSDPTKGVPAYVFRTFQFAAINNKVRLEIRFGFVNDILQFVRKAKKNYHAAYEIELVILDKNGIFVDSQTWTRDIFVKHFHITNTKMHLNKDGTNFMLFPGEYQILLNITDRDTKKQLTRKYPVKIANWQTEGVHLSSLVFCKKGTQQTSEDSLQYNFFGLLQAADPKQGIHYQIYGAHPGQTLNVKHVISNWRNDVLEEWDTEVNIDSHVVSCFEPLIGKIDHLGPRHIEVTIDTGQYHTVAKADFEVKLQDFAMTNESFSLSDYQYFSLEPLQYISKKSEYKQLVASGKTERDSLIAQFWQLRDPSPNTALNELQYEFYRRVEFSQNHFSVHGLDKAGWETDRGKTYIIFGPPKDVSYRLGEFGTPPYEIWFYPREDRYFIFRDKHGSGDFKLQSRR